MERGKLKQELWRPEWNAKAEKQGWGLFWADSEYQIQKDDEKGIFAEDSDAWTFVYNQSQKKDIMAITALAIIAAESPAELARIKEHLGLTTV